MQRRPARNADQARHAGMLDGVGTLRLADLHDEHRVGVASVDPLAQEDATITEPLDRVDLAVAVAGKHVPLVGLEMDQQHDGAILVAVRWAHEMRAGHVDPRRDQQRLPQEVCDGNLGATRGFPCRGASDAGARPESESEYASPCCNHGDSATRQPPPAPNREDHGSRSMRPPYCLASENVEFPAVERPQALSGRADAGGADTVTRPAPRDPVPCELSWGERCGTFAGERLAAP
jgi:hypothetical protein